MLLMAAAAWSVQLARADAALRAGTEAGIARAIELASDNTAYLALAVVQREAAGGETVALLTRIAELNPMLGLPRVRLALEAERRGDVREAERWLVEANSVDKQFAPRWALAQFYLRQARRAEFWTWARAALEMSFGDRSEVFDACRVASNDAAEILRRAIPETPSVREAYLRYVVSRRKLDAIAGAARGAGDVRYRLEATDVLLEAGRFADAVEVWRGLGRTAPNGITSPKFEAASTGQGFDWRFLNSEGVTHQQLEQGRGHRVRLSGRQAEVAVLLSQYVGGLRKGAQYRLHAVMEGAPEGLVWRVADRPVSDAFTAPDEVALLQLVYERPKGSARAEAEFDLKDVTVSALQ
ncbi:MAG: hypothetical protein RL328_1984 [Acidobacteriota bacterium]